MQVVPAQTADSEALRAFAEYTFRAAFQASNDPLRFEQYCSEAFSSEQFAREMAHPESAFWLAREGDVIVAYIKLNFDRHPSELNSRNTVQVERLYVAPAMQGRKIGEKLLNFALEQARNRRAEWVWLSVWQENPPAVRFYERCGYSIFGTKVFVLGDEVQTDWMMGKRVGYE